jgi:predicted LPLAT superfamily acyltransferase
MSAAPWTVRHELGSTRLLWLMFRIATLVGRPIARLLLWPITVYFWLRTPNVRADSLNYLRRLRGVEPRRWSSLKHYHSFASTILDRVYFLGGRLDSFAIEIRGEEHLADALSQRQGGFLVGAHFGSFEVLRAVGRRRPGLRITMAMYEENAAKIGRFMRAIDPAMVVDVVALGRVDSMIQIQDRLQRGHFVGFLADRSFGRDATILAPFLGEPAPFPTGIFRMAAVMRCPVLMMAGLYLGDNRYEVHIDPLVDFSAVDRDSRGALVGAAVARFAQRLEHYCRMAPFNWFNFYDFWRPADAGHGASDDAAS